jgi:hypothetical protein
MPAKSVRRVIRSRNAEASPRQPANAAHACAAAAACWRRDRQLGGRGGPPVPEGGIWTSRWSDPDDDARTCMKRWLPPKRICVFLILVVGGAIINVAVAWGLAASSDLKVFTLADNFAGYAIEQLPTGQFWTLAANRSFGGMLVMSFVEPSDADPLLTETAIRLEEGASQFVAPSWSRVAIRMPSPGETRAVGFAAAYGSPLLSNCAGFRTSASDQREIMKGTGIVIGGKPTVLAPPKSLPLVPIWPGFAINTVFYAGVLWLLFAAPFALRRWRRINRGLCPKCAYPVGASEVCTECGAAIPSPSPQARERARVREPNV